MVKCGAGTTRQPKERSPIFASVRLAEPVPSRFFELLTVVLCAVVVVFIHRGVDAKRDGQEAE